MSKELKKFTKKLFYFMMSFVLICLIIIIIKPVSNTDFLNTFDLKERIIQENCYERKIIFLGGSNLLYGFDSQQVQNAMDYEVINAGITVKTGLKAMLNLAKDCLQNGDILVISSEYEGYTDKYYFSYPTAELINRLEIDPTNVQYFSDIRQIKNILRSVSETLKLKISSTINLTQNESNIMQYFTDNGDFIYSKFNSVTEYKVPQKPYPLKSGKDAINDLRINVRLLEEKGVEIFVIYPSLPETTFLLEKDYILEIKKDLQSQNFKILGKPEDFIYPDENFYDSIYHLKFKFADERTKKIIKLLENKVK
jgi:hypothetical protein